MFPGLKTVFFFLDNPMWNMLIFSILLIKIRQKRFKMQIFYYKCSKMTNFQLFHRNFFVNIGLVSWYQANFQRLQKKFGVHNKSRNSKKTNILLFFTKMTAVSIKFEFFCNDLLLRRLIKFWYFYTSLLLISSLKGYQ